MLSQSNGKNNSNSTPLPENIIRVDSSNQIDNKLPDNNSKKIFFSFVFVVVLVFSSAVSFFVGLQRGKPKVILTTQVTSKKESVILTPSKSQKYTFSPSPTQKVVVTISQETNTSTNNSGLPTIGKCQIFPSDNPWNQVVSTLKVHPLSPKYIESIGAAKSLHPDFGGKSWGKSWGMPYTSVGASQQKIPINFTAYGSESDPGPYPIPLNAPIEGGTTSDGDRHVLVIDTDACKLYELYRGFPTDSTWNADSGVIFDLKSNALRPERWTSADAAGLPIFPGLVKYSEVASGSVNHAIRFTTKKTQRGYIHPATHFASASTDPNLPPMGLRLRLKSEYDINALPPQAKVIAAAMKKYGLILADNGGDWFFQGDQNINWDDEDINSLKIIKGDAFEAIDTGEIIK